MPVTPKTEASEELDDPTGAVEGLVASSAEPVDVGIGAMDLTKAVVRKYERVPNDIYEAKIVAAVAKRSKSSGNPMVVVTVALISDDPSDGVTIDDYLVNNGDPASLGKFKRIGVAAEVMNAAKTTWVSPEPNVLVGRFVQVDARFDEGMERMKVAEYFHSEAHENPPLK